MSELVNHLYEHGDRVAVLTETASLTYRELADRVAGVASQLGEPIMIAPTGNNLRDLYLLARD